MYIPFTHERYSPRGSWWDFKVPSIWFCFSVIIGSILPLDWSPHHQGELCVRFGWNWPGGSKKIFISVFSLLSTHEDDMALHLDKPTFSSLKNALCTVWLKLFQRFCWRRLLNAINFIALSQIYTPGENRRVFFFVCNFFGNFCKGAWPFIRIALTWIPVLKNVLCHVWLKLAK